jgi:CspA family cold shock protein
VRYELAIEPDFAQYPRAIYRFGLPLSYPSGSRASFKSPTTTRLFVTVPDLRAEFSWKPSMATGTVKWFNPTKGFGFIQPEDGGNDVFVHISAVERAGLGTLNEGQRISYEVVTERGKQAADNLKDPE